MDLVRIVITVNLIDFDVTLTSEPMDRYHAKIMLIELGRGPLEVRSARIIPAETVPA